MDYFLLLLPPDRLRWMTLYTYQQLVKHGEKGTTKGGVQCHPSEMIGREEEEEVVQARKSLPLLTSRCKLTINVSPQVPLAEWMRTIDVFF